MKFIFHHRTVSADGQAIHIEELTSALRKAGHEVIVVGPERDKSRGLDRSSTEVTALRRYLPRALYELLELSYSLVAFRRLEAAYRRHQPDIIYERAYLFLPVGVRLKRKYGLPMLLEVNAPIFHERSRFGGIALTRLARWSEEMTWRSADYVLPVTHVLADIVREAGVPDERIEVIPNAIDPDRFMREVDNNLVKQRLGLKGKIVLGFTGFVRDWHALENVIDLLATDEWGPDCHLLIVGDGPGRQTLEQRARELGVTQSLTFTGSVPHDDVPQYIAAFDVALQPGVTSYASPLKLFEYMALGRAIIAPDTPNIREILVHDKTAMLFDPNMAGSLGSAIKLVCQNPSLRTRLGTAARQAISDRKLTWENNALRIETLANRLTGIDGPKSSTDL